MTADVTIEYVNWLAVSSITLNIILLTLLAQRYAMSFCQRTEKLSKKEEPKDELFDPPEEPLEEPDNKKTVDVTHVKVSSMSTEVFHYEKGCKYFDRLRGKPLRPCSFCKEIQNIRESEIKDGELKRVR